VELISQLFAVVAVLGLTMAAVWVVRTKGLTGRGRRATRLIEVVDQMALTQQVSIQVVRVRQTEFVLAVSGVKTTVLSQAPAEPRAVQP